MKNNGAFLVAGLSGAEAERRLKQWGENTVVRTRRLGPAIIFLQKFTSPLLLILIVASIFALFLGERTNAAIILFMVVVSGVLDFVNSYRSGKAVEKMISKVVTTARVLRDGKEADIPLKYVVPGDIVRLIPGNVVPADCRILRADDFFVNQSALTGESFPAEKRAQDDAPARSANPLERRDLVFMGTGVVTGYATAEVLQTGLHTQFGTIAEHVRATSQDTEFERGIKGFSVFIMRITFLLVSVVFLVNALMGRNVLESFIFAVAIAIGLTPELLPVILSVSLSGGSLSMAKKDVVVKNLPAIQNLGSMDLLCTDKTGTLTEDHIELVKYTDSHGETSEDVFVHAYLVSAYLTGVPNPLDTAIEKFRTIDVKPFKKIDEVPFDFSRRRQSVVVEHEGRRLLVTRGAPEFVFPVIEKYQEHHEAKVVSARDHDRIVKQFENLSADGFRVLAVAVKEVPVDKRTVYEHSEETQMTFVGFASFLDPPKKTVMRAIAELEHRGVEVKILTGDNELLTQKICREIALPVSGVLIGKDIDALSDDQLAARGKETTIFARVNPVQKERIIKLFRTHGRVVGYLGDGINDAPALHAADVGISVNNAVEVAKEAADIILLKKSLHVLRDGVLEGRRTFQNTMKYMMMGLSSNFGNMFSMTVASMVLPFLPMLPAQILLNNFLYDSSQVTIPSDNVDAETLKSPPRWNIHFIRRYMAVFGMVSSFFDFITFGVLLMVFKLAEGQFQTGWFIESLTTQILVIHIIRTRKVPFLQSRPSRLLLVSTVAFIAIAWGLIFSPIREVFSFTALPPLVPVVMIWITITYLGAVEITKRIFFRSHAFR